MTTTIRAEELVSLGMEPSAAEAMARRVGEFIASLPAPECWRRVSKELLAPGHPWGVHKYLYGTVFARWDPAEGPPPAWVPPEGFAETTNIGKLMRERKLETYQDLHAWSVRRRDEFWDVMIRKLGIRFEQPYREIVDLARGVESPEWLPGAKLNIAESCFLAPPDATAIVHQAEGGELSTWTYGRLDALADRVAHALTAAGHRPGEAVACYMPMTAESVAIYLGIVKTGGVVVSIADSFAPDEVAMRLRLSGAKRIFTQDEIRRGDRRLPLYEKVVSADAPAAVVLPRTGSVSVELRRGDVRWDDFLSDGDRFDSVARDPDDDTNILFSSGTTGDPKVIPWTHTTPIKCAADGWLHHDIRPRDVVAWPSNLGWMMGPWLIYASLVNRATIALYYGPPTGGGFAQFVQDARVTMLGVVPSLVQAWKNSGCTEGLDWSAIKAFSSTGECSNVEDMLWLMSRAGYQPVIEYCGGTEIGGGYITGTVVQPASPATFSTPALGLDLVLLDTEGRETDNGEVFLLSPSIGLSTRLIHKDHHEVYYADTPPGPRGEVLRRHGDQIERLGGGYYRAHGRVDDTMNLGGIKVSSVEIERVLGAVEGVHETAAITVAPEGGGPDRLVVYVVLASPGAADKDNLKTRLQDQIKKHLNPLFKIHDIVIVDSLCRTASNKVMRRALRAAYKNNRGNYR
jgi:acetyl-CoA synthetase